MKKKELKSSKNLVKLSNYDFYYKGQKAFKNPNDIDFDPEFDVDWEGDYGVFG